MESWKAPRGIQTSRLIGRHFISCNHWQKFTTKISSSGFHVCSFNEPPSGFEPGASSHSPLFQFFHRWCRSGKFRPRSSCSGRRWRSCARILPPSSGRRDTSTTWTRTFLSQSASACLKIKLGHSCSSIPLPRLTQEKSSQFIDAGAIFILSLSLVHIPEAQRIFSYIRTAHWIIAVWIANVETGRSCQLLMG